MWFMGRCPVLKQTRSNAAYAGSPIILTCISPCMCVCIRLTVYISLALKCMEVAASIHVHMCASAALLLCMHVHKNDQMTLQSKTLWAQVNYALSMPPCPTYTFHLSPFTPAAVLILLYIYINAQIITSVFKSSSVHQLCSSVITLVLHHTLDYWSTLLTPHICTHPTPVASLPHPLHPCMVTPPPTPVHGDPTPCTCAW